MGAAKGRWKRAPRDQRRLASERSAPKARFTRGQLSGSLPPPLPSRGRRIAGKPLLLAGALLVLVGLSIALVIAVGAYIRAEQHFDDLAQRGAYYGLPTQPFTTPAPTLAPTVENPTDISPAFSITAQPEVVSGEAVAATKGALTELDGASGSDTLLSSFCDKFGVPESIRIFDWNDWSTVNLSNPLIAQLPTGWDASGNLWRGYQAVKPFDIPDDARERWELRFTTTAGEERWVNVWQSATTTDVYYAYAFQIVTPYADQNGKHFGYHPCRAFTLPTMQMDILLSSARAYGSSGSHFPALAGSDDGRWLTTRITPVSSSFDLRAIPTLAKNDPIQSVGQAVSGYIITDPSWGVWVQVKLGDTTAWIDTSTVTLEAAS